ncbi:MAG: amidohydrolase family protein [Oscillospiraceae bacterium]|jgi:hypothetical protein
MIIDFHTHAFSDEIAARAMEKLEATCDMKAYSCGTVFALLEHYKACGVDKAVLLPIATKPTQQTVINNWAKSVEGDVIIPFGSVHPDSADALNELERIKSMGMKGIKLHPDYQGFFVNDEKLFPIYEKCEQLGLIIVFHSGYDPVSPKKIHCLPEMIPKLIMKFPYLKIVLAHLGGMNCFSDVEYMLAGLKTNLYFDTAYIAGNCPDEQIMRIIKKHGADKILFASDFPWHSPVQEIEMINRLELSQNEKDNIFYKNAARLLEL